MNEEVSRDMTGEANRKNQGVGLAEVEEGRGEEDLR